MLFPHLMIEGTEGGGRMKKKAGLWIMLAAIFLAACQPKSFEEAMSTEVPFNVQKVIHKEKVKGGTIVLYLTEQEREADNGAEKVQAVAAAYLQESKKAGWKNAGHNHWEYEQNDHMTVYPETFYQYDTEGNLKHKVPVVFGRIRNDDIKAVEAGKKDAFEPAKLIETEDGRFYFAAGEFELVRGLSAEGKAVIQQRNR
jgi:hypothetical protein